MTPPKFALPITDEAQRSTVLTELRNALAERVATYSRLWAANKAPASAVPSSPTGTTPAGTPISPNADEDLNTIKESIETLQAAIKEVTEAELASES